MVSATRGDQLAHRALALGRPDRAAEVFLDDHVGRGLAPALGDLDVALLEDALAVLAGDGGRPQLPLDGGEAVVAGGGEITSQLEPAGGADCADEALAACVGFAAIAAMVRVP